MKTDALIVGAELDGLVAATRLLDHGHSVRVIAAGAGSLHYAAGGIHVFGSDREAPTSPFDGIKRLPERHPYKVIGAEKVRAALAWFFGDAGPAVQSLPANGHNAVAVSPAGLGIPTYGVARHQATFERLSGRRATIVNLRRHRDFPAALLALELGRKGIDVRVVDVDAPGPVVENAGLAKAFDALDDDDRYFRSLASRIPADTEVVLFPAVLGLDEHNRVMATMERALDMPCLEVPTLPPSVPGMRLERAFERTLNDRRVVINRGVRVGRLRAKGDRCMALLDDQGRPHEASVIVLSTGGVLMGGLDVDSHGAVHETALGLAVYQSEPLAAESVDRSLDALHLAGVETDNDLRPVSNGSVVYDNVFVTGRTLAHWNPAAEGSTEGVSIATGWAAAEAAHTYLGDLARKIHEKLPPNSNNVL